MNNWRRRRAVKNGRRFVIQKHLNLKNAIYSSIFMVHRPKTSQGYKLFIFLKYEASGTICLSCQCNNEETK